jgi:hypothetical protein
MTSVLKEGLSERIGDARPAIEVHAEDGVDEAVVRLVLEGIEEEGVPSLLSMGPVGTASVGDLAFRAALASRLGVGVGVTRSEAAVHFEKLPEDKPLFVKNLVKDRASLRALGGNAARLVKRMPFKT